MSEVLVTARQQEIYDFVAHFIDDHGYPPTRQEIADHFGLKSVNGVQQHLVALSRKGAIRLTPHVSRGISIVVEGE